MRRLIFWAAIIGAGGDCSRVFNEYRTQSPPASMLVALNTRQRMHVPPWGRVVRAANHSMAS